MRLVCVCMFCINVYNKYTNKIIISSIKPDSQDGYNK